MIWATATVFGVGHLRPAPGTWGSFVAAIVGIAILLVFGATWLICGIALSFLVGIFATHRYTQATGQHDPSEVVIDEVAGQWVALLPLALLSNASLLNVWIWSVLAFALFRLFDIWKPGPVGWADRMDGAFGVMLDDVIAGALAAICLVAALWIF